MFSKTLMIAVGLMAIASVVVGASVEGYADNTCSGAPVVTIPMDGSCHKQTTEEVNIGLTLEDLGDVVRMVVFLETDCSDAGSPIEFPWSELPVDICYDNGPDLTVDDVPVVGSMFRR
eukprot:TRINITY_DN3185_c0_g1_i1.p1 TRINITY_DN3185_c0_g1~~TRINITY_DN3185_c0_g1_i1.p1  ORF type:complete len:130 (-),score=14.00 TRINITY_DN3185_c0_g1_i1:196-549(-)